MRPCSYRRRAKLLPHAVRRSDGIFPIRVQLASRSSTSNHATSHHNFLGRAALHSRGAAPRLAILSRSASHAASTGFAQTKRTSSKIAQSAQALTAATAVRARAYGNQAFASANSWSERTAEGAQRFRKSVAARATEGAHAAVSQTPQGPSPAPDETPIAAQQPEQRSVIDLLDIAARHETPSREEPDSEPVDAQPKALAASALSKPSPPRLKPKPGKIKAKDKTHRGGRGGKKKHRQKHTKSKSN